MRATVRFAIEWNTNLELGLAFTFKWNWVWHSHSNGTWFGIPLWEPFPSETHPLWKTLELDSDPAKFNSTETQANNFSKLMSQVVALQLELMEILRQTLEVKIELEVRP